MNMGTNVDSTRIAPRVRGPHVHLLSGRGMAYLALRSGWRYFVTGDPIVRGRQDNATFLHDATTYYGDHPRPHLTRAKWRRLARRWAALGIPGSLLSMEAFARLVDAVPLMDAPGWTHLPYAETAAGYAVVMPAAIGAAYYPQIRTAVAMREVNRQYVYPTWREVCQIINHRYDPREARRSIELPSTFGTDLEPGVKPVPVRIVLPNVPLDPGVTKRLGRIGHRLGMPGAVVEAHALGSATFLDVAPAALPPARVTLETVLQACEGTDIDHPVIGVANGGAISYLDFDNDSPHVALSAGSGAGKSNTLAFLLSQRMRKGSGTVILDFKKWSHDWAHGLPREYVAYAYEIARIHDALVALGDELMRRRALDSRAELALQRVLDVVVEEANSLIPYLNDYWAQRRAEIKAENKAAREDDPDAEVVEPPVRSPAVLALGAIIQMGREFGMHVFLAGQSLSTDAFGGRGRDRRASFRIRLMAAYDRSDWNMLAKGVPYVPCPKGGRGLWTIIRQSETEIVRVPQVLDKHDVSYADRLRTWVLSAPRPDSIVCPGVAGQIMSARVQVSEDGADVVDVPEQRVPLSGATDALDMGLEALRTASKRGGFPEPIVPGGPGRAALYSLPALVEWKARRGA